MTARRPADIARELREWNTVTIQVGMVLPKFIDELDDLDARWPTADEIAELASVEHHLGRVAEGERSLGELGNAEVFGSMADVLARLLDRLDPPAPEPQADDDVDPWADLPDRIEALENTYDQRTSGHGYSERWDGYQQGLADAARLARAALDARDTEGRGR